MNLAVMNGEPIDLEREQLFDFLSPGFVDAELAARLARRVHEIQPGPVKFDFTHDGTVPKRAPFHREIHRWRGEKWHRHFSLGLFDFYFVDGVGAAQEMKVDRGDVAA